MSRSSELLNPFFKKPSPAVTEAKNEVKKRQVTVYGTPSAAPAVSLPTAQSGDPVPFIIGRQRIFKPNLIWYGNLKPINQRTVKTETVTETDPNGDEVEVSTTKVTNEIVGYRIDMQFGLCLGPSVKLRAIYYDNKIVWQGNIGPARTELNVGATEFSTGDIVFAGGQFDQAVDPYVDALVTQALNAYVGVAYIILKSVDISSLKQFSFEVERFPDPLSLGGSNRIDDDINTVTAIVDVITNSWGGCGFSSSELNLSTFTSAAAIVHSEGNMCGLYNQQPASGTDLLEVLLDQIDAVLYENPTNGLVEIKLKRLTSDITGAVLIGSDHDIVALSRHEKRSFESVPNMARATYTDRSNGYAETPLLVYNLAAVSAEPNNKDVVSLSYPAVMNGELAMELVARDMGQVSVPVNGFNITTKTKGDSVVPGQIVRLTIPDYGYYNTPFVISKKRTQPVTVNSVVLECYEFPSNRNNVLFSPPEETFFVPVDTNPYAPLSVRMFSATYWHWLNKVLSDVSNPNRTQLIVDRSAHPNRVDTVETDRPIMLIEAANSAQYDSVIYLNNYPGETDPVIAQMGNYAGASFAFYNNKGTLVTAISRYDGFTTGLVDVVVEGLPEDTIFGNIVPSGDPNVPQMNAQIQVFINDEILTFRDYSYTGPDQWTFFDCWRGILDTVAGDHDVGDVVYVSSAEYVRQNMPNTRHEIPETYTPEWALIGRVEKNGKSYYSSLNSALVDDSWSSTDRVQRPLRPHNAKIGGVRSSTETLLVVGDSVTVSWLTRSRFQSIVPQQTFVPFSGTPYHPGEIDATGDHQVHRVIVEDSASALHDCGATSDTGDDNDLVVTVPAAAYGSGFLYVQSEVNGPSGVLVSLYKDKLPVLILPEGSFITEDSASYFVTEDGASLFVEE